MKRCKLKSQGGIYFSKRHNLSFEKSSSLMSGIYKKNDSFVDKLDSKNIHILKKYLISTCMEE